MTRNLFITFLFCSLFGASTMAHNDRKYQIKIDLAHEENLIIEYGNREFFIHDWPITVKVIAVDKKCKCKSPDCYEVDSFSMDFGDHIQDIEIAHYATDRFNTALYVVFQQLADKMQFSGSQFIAKIFNFPITSWSFSPAHSLFEVKEADETLTDFDKGDVVFISPTKNVQGLTNFNGTHFAIFLGRNSGDNRPILLTKLGDEILAVDLDAFRTIFPNAASLFRLRWKNPCSHSFDCL